MVIFIQWYRPFEYRSSVWLETFNEMTILVHTYFLLCFTDFMPDPEHRSTLGLVYIGVSLFNFAVHLCLVIVGVIGSAKQRCQRAYYKRKIKEAEERVQKSIVIRKQREQLARLEAIQE